MFPASPTPSADAPAEYRCLFFYFNQPWRPASLQAVAADVAHSICSALSDIVLCPGTPAYAAYLDGFFTPQAAATRPSAIVQPRSTADVQKTILLAREYRIAATTRGGGLSTTCAATGAILIDLRTHLHGGELAGDRARMNGGAIMGELLSTLAPAGRLVPIGVLGVPGLGLATRGGIGHLTRSLGLTMDHLVEVEIVTGSGEILTLSDASTGDEADLWWAVRGCAPAFGVVTAATFRSQPAPPDYFVHRILAPLDNFPPFVDWAATLPESVSATALIGTPPGFHEPQFFAMLVAPDDVRIPASNPIWQHAGRFPYRDFPPFDPTDAAGHLPSPAAPAGPDQRIAVAEKCPFLKNLTPAIAEQLTYLIRRAPTPLCRHDFQPAGGAMTRVDASSNAFAVRDIDWSTPIIGAWQGNDPDTQAACERWVRDVWDALEPCIVGTYSTEIRPGLAETAREVALAFGENLPRMRVIKRLYDPDDIFRCYYPL